MAANDYYPNHIHIFTDGPKIPIMVGLALPWWKKGYHDTQVVVKYARLPDNLSVYTAELTAIKHALMWIKKMKYSQSVMFSDSLSSIQSIQGCQSTRPDIIAAVQIELNEIQRHNLIVTFEWLPAHVWIMGNETADAGAKGGLTIANKDMLTDIPLGINEGRKEMFYLTTHSTHFIYGYMASDIW